jgi:hypothetical protein
VLYLILVASCWVSLLGLRRRAGRSPTSQWIVPYTHMIEVSLFGFLVSGAFLGLANFDLFYQLVAMVIILKMLYRSDAPVSAPVRAEEKEPIDMAEETLIAREA